MIVLKYYAVYKGKTGEPKIFTSWDECKKEVIGFKGAIYKSFTTKEEALNFIKLNSEGKENENCSSFGGKPSRLLQFFVS